MLDSVTAMKLGIIGCLAGSAAAILFSGCAADPYATTTTYGGGYYSDYDADPVLVERRTVYVDNTPRYVPIYRTGDSYFYTYGGRRFAYDYPGVRRTVGARFSTGSRYYSSARYRDWDRRDIDRRDWDRRDWDRRDGDRGLVRTSFDEERRIRRSTFRRDDLDDGARFSTTRRIDRDFPSAGERMRDRDDTMRMTERRVRISD